MSYLHRCYRKCGASFARAKRVDCVFGKLGRRYRKHHRDMDRWARKHIKEQKRIMKSMQTNNILTRVGPLFPL